MQLNRSKMVSVLSRAFLGCSLVFLGSSFTLTTSTTAIASVTGISDSRLEDINVTPNIGRGYSPSTNTFQSLCMDEIVTTKPSANLEYTFEEVTEESLRSSSSRTTVDGNFRYAFLRGSIRAESNTSGTETKKSLRILATIKLKKYYAAMDESKSTLAPMAAELLTGNEKDMVSFFNACGPYYVKSLTRVSTLYALLTFNSTDTTSDSSFAMQLQASLRTFGGGGSISVGHSSTFRSQASSRNLKIYISGMGLDPEHLQGLLATDIPTFRAAIQNSLEALKGYDVGRVVGMEIAPWSEHLGFQKAVALPPAGVNPPWLSKVIEELNGDFVAQVARVRKFTLANYYTAKTCLQQLVEGNWSNDGKWEDLAFINLTTGVAGATGKAIKEKLDKLVENPPIATPAPNPNPVDGTGGTTKENEEPVAVPLLVKHQLIVDSAKKCFAKLASEGGYLGKTAFYEFTECNVMVKDLYLQPDKTLTDYCMPIR
ncbi:MAG: hypothetical protein HQK50_14325 [Oligoflexia bacterium]|nr:hypothetical protein [Oligoflexia bacterium]MBF0366746.1 hypothetical protein [Oligoflexia bacterium]